MKKYLLIAAGILFSTQFVSAQNHLCGTSQAMQELFESDPVAKARFESNLEKLNKEVERAPRTQEAISQSSSTEKSLSIYPLDTIPVVFHILHMNGPENVSDQVIIDALNQVNTDYQKLDADTSVIEPAFLGIADSPNLVFKLANKDPLGNCTNGIVRHYDPNTVWNRTTANNNAYNNFSYTGTGLGQWDPRKYLNIYIVKDIYTGSTAGGIVVGYTYIPGTWNQGDRRDAIVYNYGFLAGKDARSLVHEIGHWLSLIHTFGNTNSPGSVACGSAANDDHISDTPWTKGYFSICPKTNPTTGCSTIENIENFMDYSSCPRMFTQGQVTRMRTELSSATNGRNNLVTVSNKDFTGIFNTPPAVCAPIADFNSNLRFACEGGSIAFTDKSWGGPITSRTWTFNGGNPANDTSAQATSVYTTPGVYDVSLNVGNATGSTTKTEAQNVVISPLNTSLVSVNWSEGFENGTWPFNDWFIGNDNLGPIWDITSVVAASGFQCITLDNFTSGEPNTSDAFITPAFNNSGVTQTNMTFKLAYAYKSSTNSNLDRLIISSSIDCGKTWTTRRTIGGTSFPTTVTGFVSGNFAPSPSEWRTETVNLTSNTISNKPNVRFKFEYFHDSGNNIYIDDINITGTVDINEAFAESSNINVFPNPSAENTFVSFTTFSSGMVKLQVLDITGRIIQETNSMMSAGDQQVQLENKLSAGTYFIRLIVDNASVTRKVIMN